MIREKASQHTLQVFVVTSTSSTQFEQLVKTIKNTIWWNHMGSYLIINQSNNGCSNASEILRTAWKMNLLHAKFICNHWTNRLLIYSYNPFTSQAPKPWERTTRHRDENNHPWTLFVKAYQRTKKICQELDFDKTNDLGGYAIRTSVRDVEGWFHLDPKKTGLDSFGEFGGTIGKMIFKAVNATPELLISDQTVSLGYITDEKHTHSQLLEVIEGKSDIILVGRNIFHVLHLPTTRPFIRSGITIAYKHRHHISQLEKLMKVLDNRTKIGVAIVLFATFVFLKFLEQQPTMTAFLNIVRLVCNTSLLKLPTYVAPRIYLALVFFLVLTITGIYQGKLASLLTHSKHRPFVNNHGEFVDTDFTIYGDVDFEQLLNNTTFKGSFVNMENCTSLMSSDLFTACISERSHLLALAAKNDFYVSDRDLVEFYVVYAIREDWPLQDSINRIISRLSEANLNLYQLRKERNALLPFTEFYKAAMKHRIFKALRLENLNFVFKFLGIGLGLATVSFVAEVLLKLRNR